MWVGYELVLKISSLGLSESRAQWLVGWCTRLLRDRSVQMQEFQEAWGGQRSFVVRWTTIARSWLRCMLLRQGMAPHSVKPLSLYVLVTLEYLKTKILQRRHCPCALQRRNWKKAWRVDAHADENGVGVGGWWPQANEKGVVNKWDSPWFAVRVTPENSPWAFQKEGKAYRVIATLEALGLLLALQAFGPREHVNDTCLAVQVPAFTDNKENGYVVNKLMTTRFLLCAFVMELAAQAEARGVREWKRSGPQGPEPGGRRPVKPPHQRLRPDQRSEDQPERARLAGAPNAP